VSAEWVTAIATAGTFVVIAASAMAALFQLRHMRGSNEIAALTELRETIESPQFQARFRELLGPFQDRMNDPAFRRIVMSEKRLSGIEEFQSAINVGNFFENAGVLVKHRIVDADLFCDLWGSNVVGAWSALEHLIANRRLVTGSYLYENFEYLVLVSERFAAKYPNGTLPLRLERKQLPNPWPEATEYLKS
jgi:hypothetical protein